MDLHELPPWARAYVPVAVAIVVVLVATAIALRGRRASVAAAAVPARSGPPRVVLIGAENTGKTSILLRSALGAAPQTATSQHENVALVPAGELTQRDVTLVDLPGHPRLRSSAAEQLATADAVVVCIDASVASRGGGMAASLSALKQTTLQDALAESVDLLHDTLTTLTREARHVHLLVLFTRIDQSPLFADRALLGDEKRRAQLLARCRAGIDAVLAGRRASRGISKGRANRVTVGGIDEVRAEAAPGILSRLGVLLRGVPVLGRLVPQEESPLTTADAAHPTHYGHNVRAGQGHAVSDERDYVDMARSGGTEVLERLDARVFAGGCATFGLASIEQTGWVPFSGQDSLVDLSTWLNALP